MNSKFIYIKDAVPYYLLSILAFLVVNITVAQSPAYINYTVDDGLPSNETYSIFEDSKGFMWIATDRGVSRFNGTKFENFTTADGLPDNTVFGFTEDQIGRIWFRTFNGKMGFFLNGTFKIIKSLDFEEAIVNFRTDSLNRFHLALQNEYHIFSFDQNFDTTLYKRLTRTSEDYLLNQEFWNILLEPYFEGLSFHVAREDTSTVVVGKRIMRIHDDTIQKLKILEQYPTYMFIEDSLIYYYMHDNTYIALGVTDFEQKKEGTTNGVLSSRIIDSQGFTWETSLDNGIYFYPNINCKVWGKDKIIDCIGGINGDLFFSDFNSRIYKNFQYVQSAPSRLKGIKKIHDKEVFIGEFMVDAGKKGKCRGRHNLHDLAQIDSTQLVASTHLLILKGRLREGTLWETEECYKIKYRAQRILMSQRNDTVWVGTLSGLAALDLESAQFRYYQNDTLLGTRIIDLKTSEIDSSLIYISTRGKGVLLKNGNEINRISRDDGLLSDLVNGMYNDGDSVLWVATNNGLSKIRFHNSPGGNKPLKYTIKNFTLADGLSSNNVTDVHVLNDTVYVGTNKGLNFFSKFMTKEINAPKVHLTNIKVNGHDTILEDNLQLLNDQNSVFIDFIGLSYSDQDNIKYKYRLKGLDSAWYFQKSSSVQFLSLNPGNYLFEVAAINRNGIESADYATVAFNISPPFYGTWWFYSLVGVIIVVTSLILIRLRIKYIQDKEKSKRRMIEMELKALRSQMNPHFTFNSLNSIQSYINNKNPHEASEYLAKFAELMRVILENSSSEYVTIEREMVALTRYLEIESMRFEESFNFEIRVDPQIDESYEKIPSMILQPYIENAIWHGLLNKKGKGKILIEILGLEGGLKCIVEDNGIGREKAMEIKKQRNVQRKSFGMLITGERLAALNETRNSKMEVNVVDMKGEDGSSLGTKVVLNIVEK